MNKYGMLSLLVIFIWGLSFPIKASESQIIKMQSEEYDLIINGAGLDGYYVALEAAQKGMKVLLLDKRTSPGYDVVAKRKLWLKEEGISSWDKSTLDLFFPVEEQPEVWNESLKMPRYSKSGDELLLFAGSLKKGMLANLLQNGVEVLLMNDVFGILTDDDQKVTGVVVASKHGTFSIRGNCFVDATDQNFFTRNLLGEKFLIKEASFVLEFDQIQENSFTTVPMLGLGLKNNEIRVHKGKKAAGLYLLEYTFPVKTNELSRIEQQARLLAMEVAKNIHTVDTAFSKARLFYTALECSYELKTEKTERLMPIKNYYYVPMTSQKEISCHSILQKRTNARKLIETLPEIVSTSTSYVYYAGGKKEYDDSQDSLLQEKGVLTSLRHFPIEILGVKAQKTPLVVAGAGTAGTMVALGAAEKGVPVTVLEYFNDLGGTKTMGGVNDFYFGFQEHKLIQRIESERKQFAGEYGMALKTSTMSRRFYYLNELLKRNVNIVNGTIVCGVELNGKRLTAIYASENGKVHKFDAELTVDATGDADVAYFAGEDYSIGDSRMGVTQNYSHWDVAYNPKQKDYNRDYDIINSTEILEFQRGLYLAHKEAHYYDFYPMQAVRESRRPATLYEVSIADILRASQYDDVIVQSRSDYDPHYFSNTELSRCGMLLPHYDNGELVNIPYRAIVPLHIDGLLCSGKSIGVSYEAFQFIRMSADITVLGYVTGLIAAGIIKEGALPRIYSVEKVQKELEDKGFLPVDRKSKRNQSQLLSVSELAKGDEAALLKVCVEPKEEMLPLLQTAFKKQPNLLLGKALAWFGQSDGEKIIVDELTELYVKELQEGHSNHYFEVYDPNILYWKINQDIALLAKCTNQNNNRLIKKILDETSSGGSMVVSADAYTKGRIDLQLLPNYNRIVNLCFYAERNPDEAFVAGLEKILKDRYIQGFKTADYANTRWRLYTANLELLVAAAAARCGSELGLEVLANYLNDIHSDFRNFSYEELKEVTQKDFGYNQFKWNDYIKNINLD